MKLAVLLLVFAGLVSKCCADGCVYGLERSVVKEIIPEDQEACKRECRLMSQLHKMHVSKTPPGIRFEGCGISRQSVVPTCVPKDTNLVCTGDFTINVDGWFYRARVWR